MNRPKQAGKHHWRQLLND